MSAVIVDVNIWLAILTRGHSHHQTARAWFDSLPSLSAGMCRVVQLSVLRLLGNHHVMGGHVQTAAATWDMLRNLTDEDERVVFVPEPQGIDQILPTLLRYSEPTSALVADAYLAAFTISASTELVTFDRGFQQFSGLKVTVLES